MVRGQNNEISFFEERERERERGEGAGGTVPRLSKTYIHYSVDKLWIQHVKGVLICC